MVALPLKTKNQYMSKENEVMKVPILKKEAIVPIDISYK